MIHFQRDPDGSLSASTDRPELVELFRDAGCAVATLGEGSWAIAIPAVPLARDRLVGDLLALDSDAARELEGLL